VHRHGTAPIFAWRPGGGDGKRHDKETHDRHGVVRCKHCGGTTNFVRFDAGDQSRPEDERSPRLWVLCMLGLEPGCAKEQTIGCKTDWRLLVSLWRTDPVYHELKEATAPTSPCTTGGATATRSPRPTSASARKSAVSVGIACARTPPRSSSGCASAHARTGLHQLAATAANAARSFAERGRRIADTLAGMRVRMGVAAAYGEKAVLHGHGQRTPPSRRPRGAPPGQTTLDLDIGS
jgi:hypothetical protein